jgi:hypothetical protein
MSSDERDKGLRQLDADIRSGAWDAQHTDLVELDELDLGYTLIIAASRISVRE